MFARLYISRFTYFDRQNIAEFLARLWVELRRQRNQYNGGAELSMNLRRSIHRKWQFARPLALGPRSPPLFTVAHSAA